MFKRVVGELVQRPHFLPENASITEAVSVMAEKQASLLGIIAGKRIIGFVTEHNLCQWLAMGLDALAPVSTIKQYPMVTVAMDTTLDEAVKRLLEQRSSHLIVVDRTRGFSGVVTADGLVDALAVDFMVEDVTCQTLVVPDTLQMAEASSAREVLSTMQARDVDCAVVVRDDVPVGLFTERDVVLHIVPHRERLDVPVAAAMSQPVISVPTGAMVYKAILFMRQRGVRRLAVVDDAARLVGLLAPHSILAYAQRLL